MKHDLIGAITFRDVIDGYQSKMGGAGLYVYAEDDFSAINKTAFITFETTSLNDVLHTERMRITGNGNVGINTAAPQEKLEVAGKVKAENLIFTNLPVYASDVIADADVNLPSGSLYKLTTGRQVYIKP